MRRISEWRRERGSWVLCEEVRADARQLRSRLKLQQNKSNKSAETNFLLIDADEALQNAERIVRYSDHRRRATPSHVTAAQLYINNAHSLWLRTLSFEEMKPYLPSLLEIVQQHLRPEDARRKALEQITQNVDGAVEVHAPERRAGVRSRRQEHGKSTGMSTAPSSGDETDRGSDKNLPTVLEALDAAREAGLTEKLRAFNFAIIVRRVSYLLALVAIIVAIVPMFWAKAVPLCFNPETAPPRPTPEQFFLVVCPTRESSSPVPRAQLASVTDRVVSRKDYITVELVGIVAASIAAASALRKIKRNATPFDISVALAMLKVPSGALTAVLGLLFLRGAFVPGFSALDSSAQIIAWALIFGYSQELFTRFVDARGQAVLEDLRGRTTPNSPAPEGGARSA